MSGNAEDDIYDLMVYDGLWEIFGGYHWEYGRSIAAKYRFPVKSRIKLA